MALGDSFVTGFKLGTAIKDRREKENQKKVLEEVYKNLPDPGEGVYSEVNTLQQSPNPQGMPAPEMAGIPSAAMQQPQPPVSGPQSAIPAGVGTAEQQYNIPSAATPQDQMRELATKKMRQLITSYDINKYRKDAAAKMAAAGFSQDDISKMQDRFDKELTDRRNKYFTLGKAAFENGDLDAAAKYLTAAYGNFPNGVGMVIKKVDDGKGGQVLVAGTYDEATGKATTGTIPLTMESINRFQAFATDPKVGFAYDISRAEQVRKDKKEKREQETFDMLKPFVKDKAELDNLKTASDIATKLLVTKSRNLSDLKDYGVKNAKTMQQKESKLIELFNKDREFTPMDENDPTAVYYTGGENTQKAMATASDLLYANPNMPITQVKDNAMELMKWRSALAEKYGDTPEGRQKALAEITANSKPSTTSPSGFVTALPNGKVVNTPFMLTDRGPVPSLFSAVGSVYAMDKREREARMRLARLAGRAEEIVLGSQTELQQPAAIPAPTSMPRDTGRTEPPPDKQGRKETLPPEKKPPPAALDLSLQDVADKVTGKAKKKTPKQATQLKGSDDPAVAKAVDSAVSILQNGVGFAGVPMETWVLAVQDPVFLDQVMKMRGGKQWLQNVYRSLKYTDQRGSLPTAIIARDKPSRGAISVGTRGAR